MNVLDALDRLEREATAGQWWVSHHPDNAEHFIEPEIGNIDEGNESDAALIALSRNHLRAFINCATALQTIRTLCREGHGDDLVADVADVTLAPLLTPELEKGEV